jgi:quercetin dioxygenase-like cupin family protein
VRGAPSIFETRGSELCYLLCDQTKGQKCLIADQGGTSNPPSIGRSTPAKRNRITLKESTQMANAFVRGANLNTSMMCMGSIMSFLVRAQDTDGRFAMVEYRARPGNEPPPHVHLWEHEMYFVLEGKIEFHCENQVETVDAGKTIFLPKGKAHAFYIRSEYLRTLIISLATTEEPVALDS